MRAARKRRTVSRSCNNCGNCLECHALRARLGRHGKAASRQAIAQAIEEGREIPRTSFDEWAAKRRASWGK